MSSQYTNFKTKTEPMLNAISNFPTAVRTLIYLSKYSLRLTKLPDFSQEKSEKRFLQYIEERGGKFNNNKFYLVVNLKKVPSKVIHHNKVDKLYRVKNHLSINQFLGLIHPNYVTPLAKWMEVAYAYAEEMSQNKKLSNQSWVLNFPMRMKNGNYYWVSQQASVWQLDKNGRVYSHINEYTIHEEFDEKSKRKVIGIIWDEEFQHQIWTNEVRKRFTLLNNKIPTFTPKELEILALFLKDKNQTNKGIAQELSILVVTVEKHNKNILNKARTAFPDDKFGKAKEVALFLYKHGLLEFPIDPLYLNS